MDQEHTDYTDDGPLAAPLRQAAVIFLVALGAGLLAAVVVFAWIVYELSRPL
jgi:hypothetical protein